MASWTTPPSDDGRPGTLNLAWRPSGVTRGWAEAIEHSFEPLTAVTVARTRVREEAQMDSPTVAEVPAGTRLYAFQILVLEDGRERIQVGLHESEPRTKWGAHKGTQGQPTGGRGWITAKLLRKPWTGLRVGLCFLVYKEMAHQDLWRAFLPQDEDRRTAARQPSRPRKVGRHGSGGPPLDARRGRALETRRFDAQVSHLRALEDAGRVLRAAAQREGVGGPHRDGVGVDYHRGGDA